MLFLSLADFAKFAWPKL